MFRPHGQLPSRPPFRFDFPFLAHRLLLQSTPTPDTNAAPPQSSPQRLRPPTQRKTPPALSGRQTSTRPEPKSHNTHPGKRQPRRQSSFPLTSPPLSLLLPRPSRLVIFFYFFRPQCPPLLPPLLSLSMLSITTNAGNPSQKYLRKNHTLSW